MATWTGVNKSSSPSWSNSNKSANPTWSRQQNVGALSYLTTDAPDYILVGSAENETLILWGDIVFTNLIKH